MQQAKNLQLRLDREWQSKLVDGVLVAVILCLTWLIVTLTIRPIEVHFGMPGLLVYVLGLMAISMYALQQALVARRSDTTRAWYGIAGGFFAWTVIAVSTHLGLPVSHPAGLVLIMMVSLIIGLMWRPVLPVGARFFSLTLLLNWAGYVIMSAEERLSAFSPFFTLAYRATGYLSILLAVLALGWILFLTRRRVQRISGALAVWFLVSLALYVFMGDLF
jgi:hypothetical protein